MGFRSFFRRFNRGFERFNDSFGRLAATDAIQYPLGKSGSDKAPAVPGENEKRADTEKREGDDR